MVALSRRRIAPSAVVWLLVGAVYFLLPLIATFLFSIKDQNTGKCCSLAAYGFILHDPQFWTTIKLSFRLALETIVIGLLLFVPTLYWVHLKLPKLRPVIGFIALVPFVIPPIILVVGLLEFFKDDLHAPFWFLSKPDLFLVGAYVILAFPYIYFSLDAGFRAIDVHTLTAFHTFPTYIQYINETQAYPAAAVSLLSFGITWAAMLSLLLIGRRGGQRTVRVGIGR